jgi:hypothetical protein
MSPSLVKSGLIIGGHCEDNHYDKKSISEEQVRILVLLFHNISISEGISSRGGLIGKNGLIFTSFAETLLLL